MTMASLVKQPPGDSAGFPNETLGTTIDVSVADACICSKLMGSLQPVRAPCCGCFSRIAATRARSALRIQGSASASSSSSSSIQRQYRAMPLINSCDP